MKRNVNVFIGVVLCAVLCGCFVWLSTTSEDDAWSPNEIYNEVVHTSSYSSSYTNATFSASSGNGLALSMGPSSSLSRARVSVSYAGAHRGVAATPLASSPLASSPVGGGYGAGLYTTSSAQLKSFGGGGNGGAAMGGSARSAAMSNSQLPVAHGAMGMSPITYTAARVKNTPSVDPATVSSGDMMAVMSANYGMGGYTSAVYAGNFLGTYDQYVGIYGGSKTSSWGISGRRESGTLGDSWDDWLATWLEANGYGSKDEWADDWIYGGYDETHDWDGDGDVDWDDLVAIIYESMREGSNPGMGVFPTQPDIRDWLVPVGDILPLLLIALLYMLFVAIKFNFFKSFLKTKRSE